VGAKLQEIFNNTMRKIILLTLLIASIFYSCDEAASDEQIDQEAIITSGKWSILFFFDESGDKAKPYANYDFTFVKDGTLSAVRSSEVTYGTWSIGEVSNKSKRIVLNFTDDVFDPLGKEWIIREINNEKIELLRFETEGSENLLFTRK
jgi:hypothetical protein